MLFCWECDHASPLADEWVRHTRGNYVRYACPHCETVVLERPRGNRVTPLRRRPAEHTVTAWGHVLRASIELWRMPLEVGAASIATRLPLVPLVKATV